MFTGFDERAFSDVYSAQRDTTRSADLLTVGAHFGYVVNDGVMTLYSVGVIYWPLGCYF